jgi:DNA-binding IclR family transcriptional regulator
MDFGMMAEGLMDQGCCADVHRTGTQTIERAAALMRTVAMIGHEGASLSELAQRCGLTKSTAHRLLRALVREGLIRQRSDRRFAPGAMLFELGLSALPERSELQHAARGRLSQLARETNGTAFLAFRSRDEAVYALRVGSARLNANKLSIFPGTRRPLVLAAGGLAILAAIDRDEAEETIARNMEALKNYPGVPPDGVRRMVDRSFREGFGINLGDYFPGLYGFGVALRDSSGAPFAAIAVGASAEVMPAERAPEYRRALESAASDLQGSHPSC